MTFEQKIQAVVATMTNPPTFMGGDWWKANQLVETATMPAVMYINPINGTMDIVANLSFDSPNVLIAFMDKVMLDANFADTAKCVSDMKLMMKEFIYRANASGYFHVIKSVRYEVTYDRLDANLCGVIMETILKEREGTKLC